MKPLKPERRLANAVKAVRLICEAAEGVGAYGRPEAGLDVLANDLEHAAAVLRTWQRERG